MSDSDIEYLPLPMDRLDEVVDLLTYDFFVHEPISKAMGFKVPEDTEPWLRTWIKDSMSDNLSLMAVDKKTDKIVAVRINKVEGRGEDRADITNIVPKSQRKADRFACILRMLYDGKPSLYDEYNTTPLLKLVIANTREGYTNRGIVSKMIKMTVEMAKKMENVEYIIVETTGEFSTKTALKNGFKTIREVIYKDVVIDGEGIGGDTGIHTRLRLMIRKV